MASVAQVRANRLNAQKSTGPRTPEGKAVVAQNAVKHGLLAQQVVIRGEDPGEFELFRDRMVQDLDPVGSLESLLAERVAHLGWRLRRAERIENAAWATLEADYRRQGVGGSRGPRGSAGRRDRARTTKRPFLPAWSSRTSATPGARSVARLRAADREQPVSDGGGIQTQAVAGNGQPEVGGGSTGFRDWAGAHGQESEEPAVH